MRILHNFDNKLCCRTEYLIEVEHRMEKTPAKDAFRKKVAEFTKNKEDLIKIKGIHTKYGQGISSVHAYVYTNEKAFNNFEVKKKNGKKEKDKGKEETKK